MDQLSPGARIGNTIVEKEIGRGAFGRVYAAFDSLIERRVALKVIPSSASDEQTNRRALNEARAAGAIESHHILTLHQVHSPDEYGAWILEMECAEGGTLEELIRKEIALDVGRVIELARGIAFGLRAAHAEGVAHGDLKPSNVLLTLDGRPKLADFGLARIFRERSISAERGGGLQGTFAYMAPEVIMNEPSSPASDIWSFGVILYRMLAGRFPFSGELSALFCAIQAATPAPLRETLPPALCRLTGLCLSKSQRDRPPDGEALVAAFEQLDVRAPGRVHEPRTSWPLGRRRDAAGLTRRIDALIGGRGGAVLLAGEAGMGKSLLLQAVLRAARARGARTFELEAGTGGGIAFGVRRELDDAFLPVEVASGSELESAKRILVDAENTDPRVQAWAALRILREAARGRGLVVGVDDVHAAGGFDLQILKKLVRITAKRPLLLVMAGRSAEGAELELASTAEVVSLTVEPLDRSACFRLLESEASGPIALDVFDEIFRLTNGNPRFAKELLAHMQDTRSIVRSRGRLVPGSRWGATALPKRLQDLIALRLSGLGHDDRGLLEAAAVDGPDFDGTALAAVLDEPILPVLRKLQRLSRRNDVIRPTASGFRFVDPLAREVIYRDLSRELRHALHLAFATHLSARSKGECGQARLGEHWLRAGEPRKALPHLAEALREAGAHQDWRLAVRLGQSAGLLSEDMPRDALLEHSEAVLSLAACCHNLDRTVEATDLLARLEQAANDAGNIDLVRRVAIRRAGQQYQRQGSAGMDRDALRTTADALPDCLERGHAYYLLGTAAKYENDLDEAEASIRRADGIFEAIGVDDRHASALDQLASIAKRRRRFAEASALYADSARISTHLRRPVNAAISEVNRAPISLRCGEFDGLSGRVRDAVAVLELEGATRHAAQARLELARILYASGDLPGAVQQSGLALPELAARSPGDPLAWAAIEHGHYQGARGDLSVGIAEVERGLELTEASGNGGLWCDGAAVAVQLHSWAKEPGRVGELLEGIEQRATELETEPALLLAEAVLYGAPADPIGRILRHTEESGLALALAVFEAARWFVDPDARHALEIRCGANAILEANPGERRETLTVIADLFRAEAARRSGDRDAAQEWSADATDRARTLGHVYLSSGSPGSAGKVAAEGGSDGSG